MTSPVCAHGSLARSCEICERDAEIADLKALESRLPPLPAAPSPPAEAELVTRLAAAERLLREAESSVAFRGDARLQSEIESFLSSAPVPDPLADVSDAEAQSVMTILAELGLHVPPSRVRGAMTAVLSARRGGR